MILSDGLDNWLSQTELDLERLSEQIQSQKRQNFQVQASQPNLDNIRQLESEWVPTAAAVNELKKNLLEKIQLQESNFGRLTEVELTWKNVLVESGTPDTPPEIQHLVRRVLEDLKSTQLHLETRHKILLKIQNRAFELDGQIASAKSALAETRQEAVSRFGIQDSPPLWSSESFDNKRSPLSEQVALSWRYQLSKVRQYLGKQTHTLALHLLLFLVLLYATYWARENMRTAVLSETDSRPSRITVARVFERPLSTALLLALLLSQILYPQAPRLWIALLSSILVVPATLILRAVSERRYHTFLNALLLSFLVDQFRSIALSLPDLTRLLFLGQMACALLLMLFIRWQHRSQKPHAHEEAVDDSTLGNESDQESFEQAAPELPSASIPLDPAPKRHAQVWLDGLVSLAAVALGLALAAGSLGFMAAAEFVGNAVLRSSYLALVLYALVRVVDGAIFLSLRLPPLNLLAIVRHHRSKFRKRLQGFNRALAALIWIVASLEIVSQRTKVWDLLLAATEAGFKIGAFHLTVGNGVSFIITLWLARQLSRLIEVVLQEDVYPHLELSEGVPYAITTTAHYTILVVGFILAISAAGIDMTRFTILAGAFSVGLGFGLQNILNNFVSGLILLFERPIKLGDFVQLDGVNGKVERIGIRASVVRTATNAEIVVPNSKLISDKFTNWTLSNRHRGIEIVVTVGCQHEPEKIMAILLEVGKAHELVLQDPEPKAIVRDFAEGTVNYLLQVCTLRYEEWQQTQSDLSVAILKRFREEGIRLPYPQQEIHLQPPSVQ